jgi:hypothetical protein
MRNTTLTLMKEMKPFSSKKLISLNEQEKELLVEIMPLLVVISTIFRLISPTNYPIYFTEYSSYLPLIGILITMFVFALFLFTGLLKKRQCGWILLCLFQGILLIYDLSVGSILTGILTALIGGWMLMQVREKYL